MKKDRLSSALVLRHFFALFILFVVSGHVYGQSSIIVCKDYFTLPLEENCQLTIPATMLIEGGPYEHPENFIVELDKTLPLGNGVWGPPILSTSDIGKNYQARVTNPENNQRCWVNIWVATHLECSGVSTVNLSTSNDTIFVDPSMLQPDIQDFCTPGTNLFFQRINGEISVPLTCNDLGAQTVTLSGVDELGRRITCLHTMLVADPQETCDTCLVCPPAVTVSFDEAITHLMPALNAGNLSVFDAFGDAEFLSGCNYVDSTYTVSYHPSGSDFSWFVRRWATFGAGGEENGACEQSILFPFDHPIHVSGVVFIDSLQNCMKDAVEHGFSAPTVRSTRLPSFIQNIETPDPDGNYSLDFTTTGLDSVIVIELLLPNDFTTTCTNILVIPVLDTTENYPLDFGVPIDTACHKLVVTLDVPFLRRCFENTYHLQYCNPSLLTAEDAYINLSLDPLLSLTASSIPWSTENNNTYSFPLGDVPPFFCGEFTVTTMVSCDALLGQTLCATATIFPHDLCGAPAYEGPVIQTSAYCDGDSVKLAVWNTGLGNMTDALDFIVIEDIIMYREGQFLLEAGDSITLKMPANGATWRIEAEQAPGNPEADNPVSTLETCGGLNNPGLVNAFPQNDDALYVDRNCTEVRGSYDPNDKAAVPTGYGPDHTIRANADLEYKIRFQNTGTDTAFKVVIVDTLSQNLDFASLEAGASSHPYRLQVYEGGILHFIFSPIALPDSFVNEAASHGFVSFRIAQKPDLPDGTQIQNTASIYFDFNEAVVTNTVTHTIGKLAGLSAVQEPNGRGVILDVQPNPMADQARVQVMGYNLRQGLATLYDAQGKVVQVQSFSGNTCQLRQHGLSSGLYFLRVTDCGRTVASAKLRLQE